MIAVVGSRTDSFPFMSGATYGCKTVVYHEDDAYSFYYNELCGCRFLLDNRSLSVLFFIFYIAEVIGCLHDQLL